MLPAGSVLFDGAHALPGGGIVFDSWHGNVHMPALRAALRASREARYTSAVRGSMISIFELASSVNVQSALRVAAKPSPTVDWLERFVAVPSTTHRRPDAHETGQPGRAPIAYPVFFGVPRDGEDDFDHWYDDEHMTMLLGCKAWLGCRRFRLRDSHPQGWTHMALHDLADVSALASPEREAARGTVWRNKLSANEWFKGDYRVLYRLA